MPVCTQCARWWSPRNAIGGVCRDCGGAISGGPPAGGAVDAPAGEGRDRLPWHLKLLVVSFSLYMGWRLVQGVQWVAQRL